MKNMFSTIWKVIMKSVFQVPVYMLVFGLYEPLANWTASGLFVVFFFKNITLRNTKLGTPSGIQHFWNAAYFIGFIIANLVWFLC